MSYNLLKTTEEEEKKIKEEIFKSKIHFGSSSKFIHRTMKPFLVGSMNNMSIIDVDCFLENFKEALKFLLRNYKTGKKILFTCSDPEYKEQIKDLAEKTNQYYYTAKPIGGLLSNFFTISKSTKLFKDLEKKLQQEDSEIIFTKKELSKAKKELSSLSDKFNGVREMDRRPDLVVVFKPELGNLIIKEAKKVGIPTIAFVDSNYNIEDVDYPIPANNSSADSINFCVEQILNTLKSEEVYQQDKNNNKNTNDSKKSDGEYSKQNFNNKRRILTFGKKNTSEGSN